MKEFFGILKNCALFKGMDEQTTELALKHLNARLRRFKKNEIVYDFNKKMSEMGIIVGGSCQISKSDEDGNRVILRNLDIGKSFGDTLIFSGLKKAPVAVIALTDCIVVFVSIKKIIENLSAAPSFQITAVENIIKLLAQKSTALLIKNDILSKKTIREKLLAYFKYSLETKNSGVFKMPFSQEELSDYLSVNRSAMSRELTQMRKEGIVSYKKNSFLININLNNNEFE